MGYIGFSFFHVVTVGNLKTYLGTLYLLFSFIYMVISRPQQGERGDSSWELGLTF
jgi:hypothetical protein